ncbi:MAG: T9SS type A sorting domain-containing protein [Cryomorphaceae bacterium]
MKSRVLFILALVVGSANLSAQNLVPNGSFEEGITCPTSTGNVTAECADWYGSISSADFEPTPEWYHECSELDAFNPPTVAFGTQFPADGAGYIGLIAYTTVSANYRELVGVELLEPLEIGISYLVDFYICNITPDNIGLATNNFGFNFSTNAQYSDLDFPTNQSHFFIDTIIPRSDEWLHVSEVFTADSAYSYFHLGNFFDDGNTLINSVGPNNYLGYYAIDNVSISSTLAINEGRQALNRIEVFPNPAKKFIRFRLLPSEDLTYYRIFDARGAFIQSGERTSDQKTIDINHLSKGLYIIILTVSKNQYYGKFIKG